MVKRKIGILLCLLCFWLSVIPGYVQAITIEDAVEPIQTEKTCTLTVAYGYDGIPFSGVSVQLYRVANVSAECQFVLTEAFAASGLVLNGIRSSGEWNVIRSTLEAYILAQNIPAEKTAVTNEAGRVCFETLATGMYLAVVGDVMQGDLHCYFDSALVALPGLETDGRWQYSVEVHAKPGALPPIKPDEITERKVLKLWKGDEGRSDRPQSVEIEIFRDGISYETVTLSAENNWSYSWKANNDGASWKVVERNIPAGYTMTVEERDGTFVVTNVREPGDSPDEPPKTGDTVNLLLPIVLMSISGCVLILLGIMGKRSWT